MDQGNTVAPEQRAVTPHTELPWWIDDAPDSNYGCQIAANTKVKSKRVVCRLGGPDRDANAAFITRACNSHYELIDALKDLLYGLTRVEERPDSLVALSILANAEARARSALSAAKGET